jgi:lysophospholipase L1-like esterase
MRRFASLLPAFAFCVSAFAQGTTPQQINLLPIADQRYGVAPFQVIALASSYLPVTITATGPVTLNGRWFTVTGVGTVTVSAHQAGNKVYAPAGAQEQFTILPGEPVVQAQPATIVYGTPFNPSIFSASAAAVPAADPAADVPAITSQFDTSQITGGVSVSAPYNSPLLRYESSPMVETATASGREGMIPDPTMAVDHYYKVAFTCDCQRFEFAVQSRTANYRLWVDGSWTDPDAEPLQDDSPRTLFYQVAFPDKRPRQVKVMLDEGTPFFGVNAAASDTISAPQVPLGKRAIIFGDSLTTPIISEPTLPPAQPGSAGSGYPQDLGEYLNWDWWESGVSGSGFTVGGVDHLTFVQRALTDICGRKPDLVVLFGGLNDASSTEQSTQQGATNFLSELNACLPATPIYLLGPQAPSASVATAMAAAAALFPATVDFAGTAPQYWVYGNRSDPTTGNEYLYLGDLNDNAGHPTPLGHDFLAEEVAASILRLSPSLAPQAFNLFAPAPAIGSFAYSEAANAILDAGDHQISITFTPADAVNYAVVTQPVSLTVNRASSSLALTASATNILAGGTLTLTASVSPQIAGVPTGTVTFTADSLSLGNAPLDASGSAAFTTASLAPGTHSISASYPGDGNFLSASPPLPVKIIVISPTNTTLISSANPATLGRPITFTATVIAASGPTPTGSVVFSHAGQAYATVALNNGVATYTTSTLTAATGHPVIATYSGGTIDAGSVSAQVTQAVLIPTTTALASSANPAALGQPVTFTAKVTATSGATPTGNVVFSHAGQTYTTVPLSNGVATYTTSTLTAATGHPVLATYVGAGVDQGSVSAQVTQAVLIPTTTVLRSSLNPSTSGQSVTLTATVTASSGATPAGTVTFMNGNTKLGTGTLTSGVATLTTSTLPTGTLSLTARYAQNGVDAATSSTSLKQTINP